MTKQDVFNSQSDKSLFALFLRDLLTDEGTVEEEVLAEAKEWLAELLTELVTEIREVDPCRS